MQKIKKLFGEYNMTWPKVIIFAVITAVYTALINQVPFLKDTSFQDIAIAFECWFLFAIFIIVNCKTWWEASLKTFVFFLISQPLIYLIEVPFSDLGFDIFMYYRHWAVFTVLTLPGAAIAFLLKKKSWLSVPVLSVCTGYLGYMVISYGRTAKGNFPHHLLSAIFCFALAVFLIFVLLDEKKHRIAALAIFAAAIIGSAVFFNYSNPTSAQIALEKGEWTCAIEDSSYFTVEITDENTAEVSAIKDGGSTVTFTSESGETVEYYVTVSGGGVTISQFD